MRSWRGGRKKEKKLQLLGTQLRGVTVRLQGKSETASKVVDSGCFSEVDA